MALNIQDIVKLDAFISDYVTMSNPAIAEKYGLPHAQLVSAAIVALRALGMEVPKKEWRPDRSRSRAPNNKGKKLTLTPAERERRREHGRVIGAAVRRVWAEMRAAASQAAE